uniref:Uncharacterized protein n=1 Tax=Rhizophora mucronata TaxID=61149 RepID=A0A2P2ILF2_RHIMU
MLFLACCLALPSPQLTDSREGIGSDYYERKIYIN